jgi:Tol biopolymer transport system component
MLFARFSPDGRRLAYSRGRRFGNVWRVPILEGRLATWSDAQKLTDEQGVPAHVKLSPDKTQLAFCLRGPEGTHIWTMPAEGGVPRRILMDPMEQIWARWSPDGQRIAFHSHGEIWVVPQDGGQPSRLTEHEAFSICPAWSPDGREIAFHSTRTGNLDVWVLPAEGGEARPITTDPASDSVGGQSCSSVGAWNPDGREIVFNSTRSGNWDIWAIPSGGGEARRLTRDRGADYRPCWSPDGRWVLFYSDREGGRLWSQDGFGGGRLWRVPAEGGEAEPVLDEQSWSLIFSSGGDKVYFGSRREGRGNLYEKALGSSADRQLTDFAGRPGYLGSLNDTDGEFLYFTWSEDHGDLWVMDVVESQ